MGWIQKYDLDEYPIPKQIDSDKDFEPHDQMQDEVGRHYEGQDEWSPEA